jgi:hypothetical protein
MRKETQDIDLDHFQFWAKTMKKNTPAALAALSFIACLLSLPCIARADDINPNRNFFLLSEGGTTCGEYVAQSGPQQIVRMEWVLGYISGQNSEGTSERSRNVGSSFQKPATVIAWLNSYCQSHSLDLLVQAGDALRQDFIRHEGR